MLQTVIYWEHDNRTSIHPFIEDIVIKLVFANCCINPILYGLFNGNFRRAYVYYMRMLAFYFTCKMTKKPAGENWVLVMCYLLIGGFHW